ncbi:RNA-directed DNA polymerase, eukaryota, reverse transcriptase zinc-binding domain protein [Tanacetum coccineum]
METHLKPSKLGKAAGIAFGGWDWVSNSIHSTNSCMILVGWDKTNVNLMVVHMTSQVMLTEIEILKSKQKMFCSFVYASNSRIERRNLWNELRRMKSISTRWPWILMGYFNVTLKLEEHSAGGSRMSADMQDFAECVNDIKVEDVNYSGLQFTWIKSPSKPKTIIIKKLDRAMVNAEFLGSYGGAHARFHPFLISDHSHVVMHIPDTLEGTKKAFRFSNFIADKKEFIEVVKKDWKCDCDGYSMYKLVKEDEEYESLFEKVEANPNSADVKKDMSTILLEYNEAINDEEKLLPKMLNRRNLNRIMGIFDKQGNLFEWENVPSQFVKHFEKFLSNNGDTEEIDSEGLFNKKLTNSEAEAMVRDVSDTEIKEAIFGIGNDKAPGPDGFTSTFFKKSWDIVEEDVCKAIIANRLQGCLDKLISINQSAFVPGRLIQDNLLITQELLKGYNRKKGPQRCALKIDIAKAYDTVNWKFLENILKQYGYFKSERGLRQGDPMLPYLFTLVMEVLTLMVQKRVEKSNQFKYHWGCKDLKLTQLCFADDLLMLCNEDYKSVEVLKEGLMEFSKASGLVPNMNKRTIFFGSVMKIERRKILGVMPFTVGNLPMKYLGVPLINKNIGVSECNQLVKRVKQKVNDWKNKTLSYAGRLQLIAFVLASMHIYWALVFLIPKTTVKEIEKALKGFLYLGPWNEALLCKHLWNVITQKDSLWVKWVNVAKLKGKSIWEVEINDNDSGTWKAILNLRSKIRDSVWKKLGDGQNTNMWFETGVNKEGVNDYVLWKDNNGTEGKFSIKKVWEKFKDVNPEVNWYKVVWFTQCNPRFAFIMWLAMHKRLATQDRIMKWNKNNQLLCPLCKTVNDSHDNLFFKCSYSKAVWKKVKDRLKEPNWGGNWEDVVEEIANELSELVQRNKRDYKASTIEPESKEVCGCNESLERMGYSEGIYQLMGSSLIRSAWNKGNFEELIGVIEIGLGGGGSAMLFGSILSFAQEVRIDIWEGNVARLKEPSYIMKGAITFTVKPSSVQALLLWMMVEWEKSGIRDICPWCLIFSCGFESMEKPVSFASMFKDNTSKKTVQLSELRNDECVSGTDVSIPLASIDALGKKVTILRVPLMIVTVRKSRIFVWKIIEIMDGLVDDACKKVEAPPKKTGIWEDIEEVEHENDNSKKS